MVPTCCDPWIAEWMEKNWMCRHECACCPDGSYVPSSGDAKTFICRNGETLKIGEDEFGEICDSSTDGIIVFFV